MGAIESTVSYWNSAVSPRQMEFCVESGRLAESAHLRVLESKGLIEGNKKRGARV